MPRKNTLKRKIERKIATKAIENVVQEYMEDHNMNKIVGWLWEHKAMLAVGLKFIEAGAQGAGLPVPPFADAVINGLGVLAIALHVTVPTKK